MRDANVNLILDRLLPDGSPQVRGTVQNILRLVSVKPLLIALAVGAFLGWMMIPGTPETSEQLTADAAAAAASHQEEAERKAYLKTNCDPLYAQWDRVYDLHRDYGDHAATQADVDLAAGIYKTCIRDEP